MKKALLMASVAITLVTAACSTGTKAGTEPDHRFTTRLIQYTDNRHMQVKDVDTLFHVGDTLHFDVQGTIVDRAAVIVR